MARRPARCYTNISGPPYTRKKYIRSIPGSKITSFEAGNRRGDFPIMLSLFAQEACQIRHIALDAARTMTNRLLTKNVGFDNYHLKIRAIPHHVLRENKMMAFAGADRIQDGMRRAFGKPMDVAARVDANQAVASVYTHPEHVEAVKRALEVGGHKLPSPCKVDFEKGKELYLEYEREKQME
ncbi:MAG: 50S ribosomal protein L16 [Asgard group archaeon]|nr:50S ribosomal protein L16 [Asgard group archaeon]